MEKFYGKPPSVLYLRLLGCLCFAKLLIAFDKLAPRSKAYVHIGYTEIQKGYVLYDLSIKSFFVSRDVIFNESMFLFSSIHTE